MTTLALTTYQVRPLRGTAGKVFISSRDGFSGLFEPIGKDISLNPIEQGILDWALSHPKTKDSTGFLRLSRDRFAHLDGTGTFSIYIRFPEPRA